MTREVAFVSYRTPAIDGDGGNHRTYQILLDLQAEFGVDNVWSLSVEGWLRSPEHHEPGVQPTRLARLQRRAARTFENPYKLLTREAWSHSIHFGTNGVLNAGFVATYVKRIQTDGRFDVCIVDHPMFDQIRSINQSLGIPTVITSHNLESLDVARLRLDHALDAQAAGVDLANELRALARYNERLAISKVEASLLTGIGLSCQFYPYRPCGEVRDELSQIASQRQQHTPERGLFVLIGTANHAPTSRSIGWFLDNAARHGLPDGARVMVVGDKVAELPQARQTTPGVEVLGRLSQLELANLLVRVEAAVAPQRMGFGALTRLPELACAGIPTLTFPHAAFAIDPPPALITLEDDSWAALAGGMSRLMQHAPCIQPDDYACWEQRTPRPLGAVVRQLATGVRLR